jgi:hypothetical protein
MTITFMLRDQTTTPFCSIYTVLCQSRCAFLLSTLAIYLLRSYLVCPDFFRFPLHIRPPPTSKTPFCTPRVSLMCLQSPE